MPAHPVKPTILSIETLARSRLFRVESIGLRFANGVETHYERIVGSARGGVLVVAMPDPDHVFLVREYAVGTERYELGFPKGRIEADEPEIDAAERELMEEVGFGARRLDYLGGLSLAPGYITHVTHIVLARDLYPASREGDEPEAIEVVRWPLADIHGLLARDDFTEARSIAALFLARERIAGEAA